MIIKPTIIKIVSFELMKSSQFYLKFLHTVFYLFGRDHKGRAIRYTLFLVLDISAKKRKLELTKKVFTTIPHAVLTTICLLNTELLTEHLRSVKQFSFGGSNVSSADNPDNTSIWLPKFSGTQPSQDTFPFPMVYPVSCPCLIKALSGIKIILLWEVFASFSTETVH
jgi:hypothetical protein